MPYYYYYLCRTQARDYTNKVMFLYLDVDNRMNYNISGMQYTIVNWIIYKFGYDL